MEEGAAGILLEDILIMVVEEILIMVVSMLLE
jgi:hypothetical protein